MTRLNIDRFKRRDAPMILDAYILLVLDATTICRSFNTSVLFIGKIRHRLFKSTMKRRHGRIGSVCLYPRSVSSYQAASFLSSSLFLGRIHDHVHIYMCLYKNSKLFPRVGRSRTIVLFVIHKTSLTELINRARCQRAICKCSKKCFLMYRKKRVSQRT